MNIKDFVLSQQNIYLAIYSVKSYVFERKLLNYDDKQLLSSLCDPFNEKIINGVIEEVRNKLKNILENKSCLFKIKVYYKPKSMSDDNKGIIFRPIHTANLSDLIAMVSLLHALIYEIPDENNNWKLHLSNYSRLIPNNFYGNKISKYPEELFEKWGKQYKLYTQKANEYFKTFHETNEYKYEVKLDLKNFFPSVDPLNLYSLFLSHIPISIKSKDDIKTLKTIIYKLLICEIVNFTNSDKVLNKYYSNINIKDKTKYTVGIPQGLPQSFFFGNICMIYISKIFQEFFPGKSVFYVDDSYLYTNDLSDDTNCFENKLKECNKKLKTVFDRFLDKNKQNEFLSFNTDYKKFYTEYNKEDFTIKIHTSGKSEYSKISQYKDGEIYLHTLSREASQIGTDILNAYSDEEEVTLLNRTKSLLEAIVNENDKLATDRITYKQKLDRYYKFFKYRKLKLQIKNNNEIELPKELFETLSDKLPNDKTNKDGLFNLIKNNTDIITIDSFINKYKNDIWDIALSILIENTNTEEEYIYIRNYINKIINHIYGNDMMDCSYINKEFSDYLNNKDDSKINNKYSTLILKSNKQLKKFSNLNNNYYNKIFTGIKLNLLNNNKILSSFNICSNEFCSISSIVDNNSETLKRMFLNTIYSIIFKIVPSDDTFLIPIDNKEIKYDELRIITYLRSSFFKTNEFFNLKIDLSKNNNSQKIDYSIFEVLKAYRKYIKDPEKIDDLILVHKYTCDIWKNGSKHLYFYTLHNQEHAIDLIKNILKIVKTISYFKISSYDYFLLFISCYLHDISMVKIPSSEDFLLDNGKSIELTTDISNKLIDTKLYSKELKKLLLDVFKKMDGYFEDKLRNEHAEISAKVIRTQSYFNFLEASVRDIVAEISESHAYDANDIYLVKGEAKRRLLSLKFDKILLRLADLLDMCEHRISRPILNNNLENMTLTSAFHWISHLLTNDFKLKSDYEVKLKGTDYLKPGNITENIELSIFVNISQLTNVDNSNCKCCYIDEKSINKRGFKIKIRDNNNPLKFNNCNNCNFLCKWFIEKNKYLIQELYALNQYINNLPENSRFYKTNITINIVIDNSTTIPNEYFDKLQEYIQKNN